MKPGLAKRVLLPGIAGLIITGCIFTFTSAYEGAPPADNRAENRFQQTLHRLTRGLSAEDYATAEKSVRSDLPEVKQFHKAYPDAFGFITHFAANERRETEWNSVTTLYDRYELTLKVPIELTKDHRRVSFRGSPKFYLTEITEVENLDGGRFSLRSGFGTEFGAKKWEEVKNAEGKIEKVFGGIRTDAPVPGFERYKKRIKESHAKP